MQSPQAVQASSAAPGRSARMSPTSMICGREQPLAQPVNATLKASCCMSGPRALDFTKSSHPVAATAASTSAEERPPSTREKRHRPGSNPRQTVIMQLETARSDMQNLTGKRYSMRCTCLILATSQVHVCDAGHTAVTTAKAGPPRTSGPCVAQWCASRPPTGHLPMQKLAKMASRMASGVDCPVTSMRAAQAPSRRTPQRS